MAASVTQAQHSSDRSMVTRRSSADQLRVMFYLSLARLRSSYTKHIY